MIKSIPENDRYNIDHFLISHWGSEEMYIHTGRYNLRTLSGFYIEIEGEVVAALTYHLHDDCLEIISIDSTKENEGHGTALLTKAEQHAVDKGRDQVQLITTNDNLNAIQFYLKRHYRLVCVKLDAVKEARKCKPSIPLVNENGLLVQDELLFSKKLQLSVLR
ncbi:GNAT family N-acetyltransferase [Thalassobacillus hwangdonensis]|uniref:GNAT family N-acetyltransferase n=1 Tax=Thalassobacillus hwangdonensis TaxID=546108 RepID=A0ABW3KXW9_9BACI